MCMKDLCKTCGAACCRGYFTSSDLVVISVREGDSVPEHMVNHRGSGLTSIMKTDATGACIALDKETNRCTIYEVRPQVCRDMKPDSMLCRTSRRNMANSVAGK